MIFEGARSGPGAWARGSEVQHAEAAVRHLGRSKRRGGK